MADQKKGNWTKEEKDENAQRALSAFMAHLNGRVGITLVACVHAACRANGGHLEQSQDVLWRKLLGGYMKKYNIDLPVILQRLDILSRYISQAKPIQLRDRIISFEEFISGRQPYLECWMSKTIADHSRSTYRLKENSVLLHKPSDEDRQEGMKYLRNLMAMLGTS